ncbi:hypothetical protein VKT23_008567 [Stygiomarasmius scandens]|uniref:Uncharacterized protein n=1 Tax=Marasmiellus scandens TaxID=2682957 RepID=A0ABR1JGT3_9AGAR
MSGNVSFNDLSVEVIDLASRPYYRSPNVSLELEPLRPNAISDQNPSYNKTANRNVIKDGYIKGLMLKGLQQSMEMSKRIL